MSEYKESDVRRCTVCRKPVRGHVRPCGVSCTAVPEQVAPANNDSPADSVSDYARGTSSSDILPPTLAQHLVEHMGQLSASMQAMTCMQRKIIEVLKKQKGDTPDDSDSTISIARDDSRSF